MYAGHPISFDLTLNTSTAASPTANPSDWQRRSKYMNESPSSCLNFACNSSLLVLLPGMPSLTRFSFLATFAASPSSPSSAKNQSDVDHESSRWLNPSGDSQRWRFTLLNCSNVNSIAPLLVCQWR